MEIPLRQSRTFVTEQILRPSRRRIVDIAVSRIHSLTIIAVMVVMGRVVMMLVFMFVMFLGVMVVIRRFDTDMTRSRGIVPQVKTPNPRQQHAIFESIHSGQTTLRNPSTSIAGHHLFSLIIGTVRSLGSPAPGL